MSTNGQDVSGKGGEFPKGKRETGEYFSPDVATSSSISATGWTIHLQFSDNNNNNNNNNNISCFREQNILRQDLKFSRRRLLILPSLGMLCCVAPVRTDFSEERIASIIRVTRIVELGMLAVISVSS
jgi:hypothetical protein